MRLVNLNKIKEGDIIAKDIVGYEGGLLLRGSSKFKEAFRNKLIERNVYDIYIEDEYSEDIVPVEIINLELRNEIQRDMRYQFEKFEKNVKIDYEIFSYISEEIMNELSSKDLVCEIMDLKINDNYTYDHCISVAILTAVTCRKMKLGAEMSQKIVMGALMHDIGKIIIPKDILNKPDKLTPEEYDTIKAHPETGYRIIKDHEEISPITKLSVLCHHEREDGSGYPLGKGADLHIGAKIVAACDVFHALLSERPYRQELSVNEVVNIARREKINPEVRSVIESILAFYPVGSSVLLNNGDVGIVEKNFAQDVTRPLIKVLYNQKSDIHQNYRVNLQDIKDLYIVNKMENLPFLQ